MKYMGHLVIKQAFFLVKDYSSIYKKFLILKMVTLFLVDHIYTITYKHIKILTQNTLCINKTLLKYSLRKIWTHRIFRIFLN